MVFFAGRSSLLLLSVLLAADVAHGTEKTIRLDEAIELALRNRPAYRAAEREAGAKEAEIGPRGAYENPMLGFAALNYPVDTFSAGEFGMTGNEFSLSQRISFPGKLTQLRNAAEREWQSRRQGSETVRLELVREVRLAYYELFLAQKKRAIFEDQLGLVRQLIGVTRGRYALGKVSQAELLSLQIEEGGLLEQIIVADRAIRVGSSALVFAIGGEDEGGLLRAEPVQHARLDLSGLTAQALGEKAVSRSPRIKATSFEVEAADSRVSYAKFGFLPDLEFRVAYMQRQASPGDRGVNFVSGGVGLSLPLWAFSRQREELKGAREERAKAEALLDQERLRLLHQIRSTFAELEESDRRIKLIEGGLLPLAKQAVLASKSAYLTGKIDYTTVLGQIRSRYQTEYSLHEAVVSHESKVAELETLMGGPLEVKE